MTIDRPNDYMPTLQREDFEKAAALVDDPAVTADAFREMFLGAVDKAAGGDAKYVEFVSTQGLLRAAGPEDEEVRVGPFEISVYGVVSIAVDGVFTPGQDWKLAFDAKINVTGSGAPGRCSVQSGLHRADIGTRSPNSVAPAQPRRKGRR